MEFVPPKKTKLYENIMEQMIALIKDGTLKPGDKIPSERKLAEDMQVSRTAIREALRSLETMGYLVSNAGGGTRINEITLENVMSPFSAMLSQNKRLMIELLDVRLLLETEIARLAAEKINLTHIKKIQRTLDQMQQEIDAGQNGINAENAFHNALADASGNQAMKLILDMCGDLLSQTREATLNLPGQSAKTLRDHEFIFEAVRSGDAALAASRMKQHLKDAQKNIENAQR